MLDELYQDLILSYAQQSSHVGTIPEPRREVSLKNPLCGDLIVLCASIADDKLDEVKYTCEGCLISKAAAALMAQEVQGKSSADASRLVDTFSKLIQGEVDEVEIQQLGDLNILAGVRKFPARARCALLAFEALKRVLHEK